MWGAGALDAAASLCRIGLPLAGGALAVRGGAHAPFVAMAAAAGVGLLACWWQPPLSAARREHLDLRAAGDGGGSNSISKQQ